MNIYSFIKKIEKDEKRNADFLHLTANENQMSNTARTFLNSKISERYFSGAGNEDDIVDYGNFTSLGLRGVEELVCEAKQAVRDMLSAADVNLNVLSGVHAMMSAILSTTEPGDTIMTVALDDGGHFATKGIIERTGRKHIYADYDYKTLTFDAKKIAQKFRKTHATCIYLDVSYCLNAINISEIRAAIGKKPIIIYDASHTMGLIMGNEFQNPFREGADVICANTHKTLPGPHKGMVVFKDEAFAKKANAIINGSLYSTPHITHVIALSIAILEMKQYGRAYARQIIRNSNAFGQAFVDLGYDVRLANTGRFSENHQCHVFTDTKGDYMELYKKLIQSNIATNFQGTEFSQGRWFMRIGSAEVTRRGMKENEMKEIAHLMDRAMKGENVKRYVQELNAKFTKIFFSFDQRQTLLSHLF